MVRKISANKTQLLHQRRLRQFPPRQPLQDLQITTRECKPDAEVIIEHEELEYGNVNMTSQYLTAITKI